MFAVLFGSYSIPITVAGIPSLFLLKSMILYFCLDPPPWCLTVILPWLLRPAVFFLETRRDFSGLFFVISELSREVICLLEGVYGLYVLIPMMFSFHTMKPHKVWGIMRCYCPASQQINEVQLPVAYLTVPRRSRCPCCPRSEQRLPSWS